MKRQTASLSDREMNRSLRQLGLHSAPMPKKIGQTGSNPMLVVLSVAGALFVLALYIGIPFIAALHTYLLPVLQDGIVATAVIIEVGLLMLYIIMRTNGNKL